MGELLAKDLPLALGAAVSPVVVILQMMLLSRGRFGVARAYAVALGCAVDLAIVAAVVLLATNATSAAGSGSSGDTGGMIKVVLALVLVGLGVRTLTRHDDDAPKEPKPEGTSARVPLYFVIGIGAMASNLSTLALFIPAMHDIAVADVSFGDATVVVALVMVIALVTAYAPPLAVSVLGDRGRRAMDRLNGVMTRHKATINAAICFVFAIYLGVSGISALD